MGLESGTNVGDLVATNPLSSDQKSQGDDHLRLIKGALLQSFAGFTGAIHVTGTDGGAANAYTLTPATALLAYGTKMIAVFAPTVSNTGAATLNISGLGAKAIKSVSGADLTSGDLVSGSVYAAFYNGTEFRLLSVTKNYVDQLSFSSALPAQSAGVLGSDGTNAAFTALLKAGTMRFADSTDTAKRLAFDVAGVTTGQTRTATVPDYSGTLGLRAKGADIASAATVNLDAATGDFVHITGTTTITAITLSSGIERTVVFDGALTLTHNATSLILPGGANITTAAGDTATFRGEGSGNVRCVSYAKAAGTAVVATTPGWTLLSTVTASNSATVDVESTFDSTYDAYALVLSNVVLATDNTTLTVRMKIGGAYLSTATYFSYTDMSLSSAATYVAINDSGNTSFRIASDMGNAAGEVGHWTMFIHGPTSSRMKTMYWHGVFHNASAGALSKSVGVGGNSGTGALTGIRFLAGSGNISSGTFRLYGIKNS